MPELNTPLDSQKPQETPPNEPPASGTPPADPAAPPAGSLLDAPAEPGDATPPADPPAEPEPLTVESLTLPEGFEIDEEAMNGFLETANEAGLSAEAAQKMIGLHSQLVEGIATSLEEQWSATQEEWRTAVRALPDIGGANLEPALGEIAKLVNRYGDQSTREAFALTGAGNHPAVVQFLHKIAKEVNERQPVSGTPPAAAPTDRASRMFGSTTS